jgi:hypothetical protein
MKNNVFNKFAIHKMYLIIKISYYISVHHCIIIKTFNSYYTSINIKIDNIQNYILHVCQP